MINEGDALLAHVTVEDHNSFTAVWSGTITYNRSTHVTVSEEEVCAENNRDPITNEIYPFQSKIRQTFDTTAHVR